MRLPTSSGDRDSWPWAAAATWLAPSALGQDPVTRQIHELLAVLDSGSGTEAREALAGLARLSRPAAGPLARWILNDRPEPEGFARGIDEIGGHSAACDTLRSMGPAGIGPAVESVLAAIDNASALAEPTASDIGLWTRSITLLADLAPYSGAKREAIAALERPDTFWFAKAGEGFVDGRDVGAFIQLEWRRLRARSALVAREVDDEALTAMLESDDRFAVEFAAESLGLRRGSASAWVPPLLAALERPLPPFRTRRSVVRIVNPRYRRAVVRALVAIAPNDPKTLPAHIARLGAGHSLAERRASVQAMGRMGAAAAPAVATLKSMRSGRHPELLQDVVETLGAIGPPAAEALPMLRELAALARRRPSKQQLALAAEASIATIEGR